MKNYRFSVRWAMIAVALIGLVITALVKPTELTANGLFTVSFGLLGVALLGLIHGRIGTRVGWTGYLVFAAGYLAICFLPWVHEEIEPNLLTSKLFDAYYDQLSYSLTKPGEPVWVNEWRTGYDLGYYRPDLDRRWDEPSTATFTIAPARNEKYSERRSFQLLRPCSPAAMHRLGHSLASIFFGMLGAAVALRIAKRPPRLNPPSIIGVDPPISPAL